LSAVATAARVVVTGIGLVCPRGASPAELLASGAGGTGPEWFDPERHLGRRGFKYLTPATRYLLAAASLALEDASLADWAGYPSEARGVVAGTNFAAAPVLDAMDRLIVAEGADALSPAQAPNFSVNIPASHVSMRHSMQAFNISLTTPMIAGLQALILLLHAIEDGRSTMGLAAATEDRPTDAALRTIGAPAGDGAACCFVLERLADALDRGARPLAELAGGFSWSTPPDAAETPSGRSALARVVGAALDDLVAPGDTVHLSSLTCGFAFNRTVNEIVWQCLEGRGARVVAHDYHGSSGGYFTVSPLLQAAASVADAGSCLVVASSPHGTLAAVSMRPVSRPAPGRSPGGAAP
jgi:3-oxoacyl-[acyl-carrier-protein] synthase II